MQQVTSLGIGRVVALRLAAAGAEVYGISKTAAHLDSLRAEANANGDGGSVKTFCQDVANWTELRALLESLPVMDGLVNNAGVAVLGPAVDVTEADIDT